MKTDKEKRLHICTECGTNNVIRFYLAKTDKGLMGTVVILEDGFPIVDSRDRDNDEYELEPEDWEYKSTICRECKAHFIEHNGEPNGKNILLSDGEKLFGLRIKKEE